MFLNSTGSILDPRFKCAWIRQAGLNEKAVLNAVSSEIEIRCDLLRSSESLILTVKLESFMNYCYHMLQQPAFLRRINRMKLRKTQ